MNNIFGVSKKQKAKGKKKGFYILFFPHSFTSLNFFIFFGKKETKNVLQSGTHNPNPPKSKGKKTKGITTTKKKKKKKKKLYYLEVASLSVFIIIYYILCFVYFPFLHENEESRIGVVPF
eukprot:PhM_4_TR13942/c4_g1_i1/m.5387